MRILLLPLELCSCRVLIVYLRRNFAAFFVANGTQCSSLKNKNNRISIFCAAFTETLERCSVAKVEPDLITSEQDYAEEPLELLTRVCEIINEKNWNVLNIIVTLEEA